jgi:actin-related protein
LQSRNERDDDENVPLSGISLSAGGGMTNIALSYKGLSLQEFSVTKSGDYIDEQAAIMTGSKKSKVIKVKEKSLDLNKFDINDRIQSALVVYYGEMIDRMIHYASNKFKGLNSEVDGEIEIVVAGGTSMAPGFCQKLQEAINNENFPFKVYRVRHSETPFYSVSQGACIRAQADYNKKQK